MKAEEQAREKRCCGPEGCGSSPNFYERMCIASDCMGWEWSDTRNQIEGKHHDWEGDCGLKRKSQ